MMTVKDEEEWIELAMRSVATMADEIVFVDNGSTDRTPEIAAETARGLRIPVKLLRYPEENFCDAVNYTLRNTTRRWILRWHGDFVGHTDGPHPLNELRKKIEELGDKRYFCILLGPTSLDGDLFHQEYQPEVEREPLLFAYSPGLRYEQVGRFESLHVPAYYEKLDFMETWFFHLRWVKPAPRLLRRWFWTEWMSIEDKTQWPTLLDYVRSMAKDRWGIDNLDDAAKYLVNARCRKFVRYDESRYGPYPELLRERIRKPSFQIVYRGSAIVGRSDTLDLLPTISD